MHLYALQQSHHPAAQLRYAPAPQQDALALHTLDERHVQQTPLGQWACAAPGGFAWVSVADGVASSPCADLASRSFLQVLHRASPTVPPQARQLPGLVRQARLAWRAQYLKPRTRGAACTLASLLYADGQVCAVNSGDARIWRLRAQADGSVQWLQISRDHTAWQQMLDDGEADAGQTDEAASIYQGLMHCLVLDADDEPDADDLAEIHLGETDLDASGAHDDWLRIWHGQAAPGDAYLLATDGLHGALTEAQMQALWQAAPSPQDGLRALHHAWRRAGAQDDVSVVLLQTEM
ncbi:MAG TPA: protein phosphatase 2C domain-containing protein [Alicycliphilus sp.]|nr:protein phosphatase 2C domain-containing protein [Alicycliphilus sp.]